MVATCVFVLLAAIVLQPIHRAYAEALTPDTTLPEPTNEGSETSEEASPTPETASEPASEPEPESQQTATEPEAAATAGPLPAEETAAVTAAPPTGDDTSPAPTTTPLTTVSNDTAATSAVDTLEALVATTSPETASLTAGVTTLATATTTETGVAEVVASASTTVSTTTSTTTPSSSPDSTTPSVAGSTTVPFATSTATTAPEATTTNSTTSSSSSPAALPPSPPEIGEPESLAEEPPTVPAAAEAVDESATSSTPQRETASTSAEIEPVQVTHTTEANAHQFAKDDCVLAGTGAYYCNRNQSVEQFAETSVFAAPDAGGDTEIFVRVDGDAVQITNDVFDDGSPHYDDISDRVVWHSLRGDRYQIVSYDFTTERERLLTETSYNNMEPVAFGERIAWQAWRGGDWEIMLFDGETTVQLTSNDRNDVAPSLYADYVMWQSQFADGARLAIYDINTGSTEYMQGSEDVVAAQNPRMVLLYDQVDADGSTATFGFDMESRETIPLGRVPTPLPDRLPSPEEPGSEKALVHAQPTLRESERGDDGDLDTSIATGSEPVLHESDLVLNATGTTPTPSADVATVISDVVVPTATSSVATTSSGQSTEHILDVVIPPRARSSSSTSSYEDV